MESLVDDDDPFKEDSSYLTESLPIEEVDNSEYYVESGPGEEEVEYVDVVKKDDTAGEIVGGETPNLIDKVVVDDVVTGGGLEKETPPNIRGYADEITGKAITGNNDEDPYDIEGRYKEKRHEDEIKRHDEGQEQQKNSSGGWSWWWLLLPLFIIALIVFVLLFVMKKGKKTACGVGKVLINGKCKSEDGGFCMFSETCQEGSSCNGNKCMATEPPPQEDGDHFEDHDGGGTSPEDLTRPGCALPEKVVSFSDCTIKRPKRRKHEFDVSVAVGDIRNEYARVKTCCSNPTLPDTIDPFDEDVISPMIVDQETVDVSGLCVPYRIENGRYSPMLMPKEDIQDMCGGGDRGFIFLCQGGRLLLVDSSNRERTLATDRSVDRIMLFGNRIMGLDSGTLVVLSNVSLLPLKLPPVGIWEEATSVPTRIISHFSISTDGKTLHIRDVEHAYELDEDLQVVRDLAIQADRFLGENFDEFIDVDDETQIAVTSTGQHVQGVTQAVMVNGEAVCLTQNLRTRGVKRLYTHNGEVFSLARGL